MSANFFQSTFFTHRRFSPYGPSRQLTQPAFIKASLGAGNSSLKVAGPPTEVRNTDPVYLFAWITQCSEKRLVGRFYLRVATGWLMNKSASNKNWSLIAIGQRSGPSCFIGSKKSRYLRSFNSHDKKNKWKWMRTGKKRFRQRKNLADCHVNSGYWKIFFWLKANKITNKFLACLNY